MWLPKSESEIIKVVNSGVVYESPIFDAKEIITQKSQEIAKDIAAMANEGGVIIYGLGEDENKRVTRFTPVSLNGQRERIDAIVRSLIVEPPLISISEIPSSSNPSLGYLMVFVPLSDRAPHMVCVKGEFRYYGRSATGNTILTEAEVARLYQRREIKKRNIIELIKEDIIDSPIEPDSDYSYLYVVVNPVYSRDGFFPELEDASKDYKNFLSNLVHSASLSSIYKGPGYYPDFSISTWRLLSDGIQGLHNYNSEGRISPNEYLSLKIDFDGKCHLVCGRAGKLIKPPNEKWIFPETILGLMLNFLNFLSQMYQEVSYLGMIDIGVGITGLEGGLPPQNNLTLYYSKSPYQGDLYSKSISVSSLTLSDNPKEITRKLLLPLFNSLTQGKIDYFANI